MLSQIRLSVCPSHGWISRKRLKLGSCSFHHTSIHQRALILFIQTLALYKSFTYLLTYLKYYTYIVYYCRIIFYPRILWSSCFTHYVNGLFADWLPHEYFQASPIIVHFVENLYCSALSRCQWNNRIRRLFALLVMEQMVWIFNF